MNKTIDEIREIYSSYPDPHCTPYQGEGAHKHFDSVAYEQWSGPERCDRWFYEYDHGYHSMSSEVRIHSYSHYHWMYRQFPTGRLNLLDIFDHF